jgi:hypothetical protein
MSKMRWNDEGDWVWSKELSHEPIVSTQLFDDARQQAAAGRQRPVDRKPRAAPHPYAFRQLIRCAVCHRRMEANHSKGNLRYRCRYPNEYAIANKVEHPRNVYVREDAIVPPLDRWLARVFDPENLDDTLDALETASVAEDVVDHARAENLRARIADCDARLAKYRAALEAGTDPAVVQVWITEVQAKRVAAEIELDQATRGPGRRMSRDQLASLITALRDILTLLGEASAEDKAAVYAGLGLQLTYDPARRVVTAEAHLAESVGESSCRRGDLAVTSIVTDDRRAVVPLIGLSPCLSQEVTAWSPVRRMT